MGIRNTLRGMLPRSLLRAERVRTVVQGCANGQVISGPFAGLKYVTSSQGSVFLPKLMGTYERELEPTILSLLATQFERIIVAGAAEGYYAVGFAARASAQTVVAFEPSVNGRRLLGELASLNGVAGRVSIHPICDIQSLSAAVLDGATLVFVDIEGSEAILLDPIAVPKLRHCHLLVEIHEFAVPGVGELIRHRFSASHDLQEFHAQPRDAKDIPSQIRSRLPARCEGAAVQAMSERRPPGMSWMYATPKDRGTPA